MLPLYQVLIVVVFGIIGSVLYLYKPDDPTDTEDQRNYCRNCRHVGLIMVIIAAIGALYILFFSKLSFRATQPSGYTSPPNVYIIEAGQPTQAPPPPPKRTSVNTGGLLKGIEKIGSKIERGGKKAVEEVAENPEILGVAAIALV